MKLAARLTLQGLVRALRGRGHDLADQVEAGYRRDGTPIPGRRRPKAAPPRAGRARDDVAGR